MKACLAKLGLTASQDNQGVPSLSRLHLSVLQSSEVSELVSSWTDIVEEVDGEAIIKGENDTFQLEKQSGPWNASAASTLSLQKVADALPEVVKNVLPNMSGTSNETEAQQKAAQEDAGIVDYDKLTKRMLVHDTSLPDTKQTPYFNHHAYFANLAHYKKSNLHMHETFGNVLLYGEVVTSTSTLLEKNPKLLEKLPIGTTATATTQVAGRGRGNNVWVSPPGSLMFSTMFRHPLNLSATAPVVFVQYLAALAIVEGIQNYDRGYDKLPIKLKWPNDIYALDPSKKTAGNDRSAYVKIGGILVNSSYSGGDYTLITGIGLNVSNAAPTTSLNALCATHKLAPMTLEKLLASILVRFETIYLRFCSRGFAPMLDQYYANWLHRDQIVTLEQEGGARARIKGITEDWGLLVAEELGWEDRPTGRKWELQSDSNSFDFFKGLLKRKN